MIFLSLTHVSLLRSKSGKTESWRYVTEENCVLPCCQNLKWRLAKEQDKQLYKVSQKKSCACVIHKRTGCPLWWKDKAGLLGEWRMQFKANLFSGTPCPVQNCFSREYPFAALLWQGLSDRQAFDSPRQPGTINHIALLNYTIFYSFIQLRLCCLKL